MGNEAGRAPGTAITESDRVVLTHPLPAHDLEVGAIGTVVAVHDVGAAFHVQFAGQPRPIRIPREQVRPAAAEGA